MNTYEADVAIIGGGLAGIVTALELLDQGKDVVLLELNGEEKFGGLARVSFGGIFVVGSREQRRAGFRDTVDLALADWISHGELDEADVWPRRWAEAYVSQCHDDVYVWLRRNGIKFFPVVHWVERGISTTGNTVPRFHIVWGTGEGLVLGLLDKLEAHPHRSRLRVCLRHRVTGLTRSGGSFSGCTGTHEVTGEEFEVEAGCVVVASGGIMGDLDRVRRHWPRQLGEPPEHLLSGAQPAADGNVHDLAEAQGAKLTHLDRMWLYAAGVHHWRPDHELHGLSVVPSRSALWLNFRGERMGPPAVMGSYDARYAVETICRQKKRHSWQIMNQRIARRELSISGSEFNHAAREKKFLRFVFSVLWGNPGLVQEFSDNCPDFVAAGTLPELAAKMNALAGSEDVDPERLAAEVRRYDELVARGPIPGGDDQVLRIAATRKYRGDRVRTCKFARIDDPRAMPFIAIRSHILTRKSLGGIQTDLRCRVLDLAGEPLPGLYAVGEAAGFGGGGVHGIRSLEGTFLGGCVLGGRLAARSIEQG
jgi:predicted oxidoreductase